MDNIQGAGEIMIKKYSIAVITACAVFFSVSRLCAEGTWPEVGHDVIAITGNVIGAALKPIPATLSLIPKVIRPVTREMVEISAELKNFVGAIAQQCPLATAAFVVAGLSYAGYKLYRWLQRHPHYAHRLGLIRFVPVGHDELPTYEAVAHGNNAIAVAINN